jgi:hypothetical protein
MRGGSLPERGTSRTQKGAGIAASPHVTGLRLLIRGSRNLVSAACSARAGKGMRASRRSPGPADPPDSEEPSFFSGPRRPAPWNPPKRAHKALRMLTRAPRTPNLRFRGIQGFASLFGPILRATASLARRRSFRLVHPADPWPQAHARASASASGSTCSGVTRRLAVRLRAACLRNHRCFASPSRPRRSFPKAPVPCSIRVSS